MVVLPNTAAQELDSGFPHAGSCRLEAVKKLARLTTIQVVGASGRIRSHFPPKGVKDDDDGDHSGDDDNPAAKQKEKA